MKASMNIIIISIFSISVIFSNKSIIPFNTAKLSDYSTKNSNINLTIESEEDIYGIQFDITYNSTHLALTENLIVSKVHGIKVYSRIREDGYASVLMVGLSGEKILDATSEKIIDLIDIEFKPEGIFRDTSIVELHDITIAGKYGIEVDLDSLSMNVFEVSFLKPESTSLSKIYPNPFNTITTIDYQLSDAGMVTMVIYDLKGVIVKTLVEEYQKENYHNIVWDGRNNSGHPIESGRYILQMSTPGFSDTITITLLN